MRHAKLWLVLVCLCLLFVACKAEPARTTILPRQDSPLLAEAADYLADLPQMPYDRERHFELKGYLSRALEQPSLCLDNVSFYPFRDYRDVTALLGNAEADGYDSGLIDQQARSIYKVNVFVLQRNQDRLYVVIKNLYGQGELILCAA